MRGDNMARKRRTNLELNEDKVMNENIFEPIIQEEEVKLQPIYKVHVTHPSLRRRGAPNLSAEVKGLIQDQGYYEIFDEANGWGKLEDGSWIMLTYTERVY